MLRLSSAVALGVSLVLCNLTSVLALSESGTHGAVASESAVCSNIGVDILKQNGSAADAMIATCLCVGTISAYHSGIGGGGFMTIRYNTSSTTHDYQMIDFRETMPAAGFESLYVNSTNPNISTVGGLAVAVPAEFRAWEKLHSLHGKLPWKTLFQPAIKLAREGFQVDLGLAARLDAGKYPFLLTDKNFKDVYAPNGTLLKFNDTVFRPTFANTLEQVAEHGANAFYTGELANNTVQAIKARGGVMTTEDLANYTIIMRQPANITYRGHRIFSTIAPSSGSIVLSAFKIFEGYNGSAGVDDPAINLTTHRLIQATRFGFGQRVNYGDPAFTANVSLLEKLFLEESTAAEVRNQISDTMNFVDSHYDISNYLNLPDHGTSHMVAADDSGLVLSVTTTINLFWGSQIMTKDGIILNSEMPLCRLPGKSPAFSPANRIAPFKRPLSSIASTIAEDLVTGEFRLATGSAGGARIISTTIQNVYHHLDQKMDPTLALHQPRWNDMLTNQTYFDEGSAAIDIAPFSPGTKAFLANIDYNVTSQDETVSRGHMITANKGTFYAANDPRSLSGGGAAY
ncbi:gamma-glutamyltranspeptidase [Ramaria rubella]|nr:gamma-glutamyltranspeptidase [Ramaria rubella]